MSKFNIILQNIKSQVTLLVNEIENQITEKININVPDNIKNKEEEIYPLFYELDNTYINLKKMLERMYSFVNDTDLKQKMSHSFIERIMKIVSDTSVLVDNFYNEINTSVQNISVNASSIKLLYTYPSTTLMLFLKDKFPIEVANVIDTTLKTIFAKSYPLDATNAINYSKLGGQLDTFGLVPTSSFMSIKKIGEKLNFNFKTDDLYNELSNVLSNFIVIYNITNGIYYNIGSLIDTDYITKISLENYDSIVTTKTLNRKIIEELPAPNSIKLYTQYHIQDQKLPTILIETYDNKTFRFLKTIKNIEYTGVSINTLIFNKCSTKVISDKVNSLGATFNENYNAFTKKHKYIDTLKFKDRLIKIYKETINQLEAKDAIKTLSTNILVKAFMDSFKTDNNEIKISQLILFSKLSNKIIRLYNGIKTMNKTKIDNIIIVVLDNIVNTNLISSFLTNIKKFYLEQ
jgi:hypothetical protein